MGLVAGTTVYVGVGPDRAWLSEALLVLFRLANRWTRAAAAECRSRGARGGRTTPARLPVHCTRRRQLLPGHDGRSCASQAPIGSVSTAPTRDTPRGAVRTD